MPSTTGRERDKLPVVLSNPKAGTGILARRLTSAHLLRTAFSNCGLPRFSTASLPRRMQRQFCLRHVPVHPMVQFVVELARSFTFGSLALAECSGSALKLSDSVGRVLQLFNRRLKLNKLLRDQLFFEQHLFPALMLESCFVSFTIRFAAAVHCPSSFSYRHLLHSLHCSKFPSAPRTHIAAIGRSWQRLRTR